MKDPKIPNQLLYSELNQGSEFKVELSPKLFHILAKDLYQFKERAIIRELSCNAIDAQVEAGTTKLFDVKLPTLINQMFYVRDYGTGLSEEKMHSVFVVLFKSTKEDSNDSIGMLGLGCKSPFSYTDNFSITSYQDGYEKTYTAFMDDNKVPRLHKVFEQETEEENGLKIQFAVEGNDVIKFHQEAKHVFKTFFTHKPNLIGADFTVDDLQKDMVWFGDRFIVDYNTSECFNFEYNVVQGNISYPIDKSKINLGIFNGLDWKRGHKCYVLADIGEIRFLPNREQIDDCESNYQAIEKHLLSSSQFIENHFYKKLDEYDTQQKVCDLYGTYPHGYHIGLWNSEYAEKYLTEKGFYCLPDYKIKNANKYFSELNLVINKNNYKKDRKRMERLTKKYHPVEKGEIAHNFDLLFNNVSYNKSKTHIILFDSDKRQVKRAASYMKDFDATAIYVKDISNKRLLNKFLKEFKGFAIVKKVSEIEDIYKKNGRKINHSDFPVFTSLASGLIGYPNSRDVLSEVVEDEDKDFYYICSAHSDVYLGVNNYKINLNHKLKNYIKENFSEIYKQIVVLTKGNEDRLKKKYGKQAISFNELLIEKMKKDFPFKEVKHDYIYDFNKGNYSERNDVPKFYKLMNSLDIPLKEEYTKISSGSSKYKELVYIVGSAKFLYSEFSYEKPMITRISNYLEKTYPLAYPLKGSGNLYESQALEYMEYKLNKEKELNNEQVNGSSGNKAVDLAYS